MSMSQQKSNRRREKSQRPNDRKLERDLPDERSAEAITIAWTASVTAVFFANLVTIAAHFYSRSHPDVKTAPAFEAIMLLTAALMGVASLALLPVVWKFSRLKPPLGFVVFATLVAAGPIVVTAVRLMSP
jgi:hypothetical protein